MTSPGVKTTPVRGVQSHLTQYAENCGSNAWFGAVTAVITVMTGGLASFFTEEIKNNLWPFFLGSSLSLKASGFWLGVLLTGFCLGLGQWAQGRKSARATGQLENMVARLQTLPADNFLPAYQASYRIAAQGVLAVILSNNSTLEQIEQAIRNVLGAILNTAKEFDKAWDDTEYSASIMLWCPRDDLHGVCFESSSPLHIAPFVKNDPRLAGALELIPALSTTSGSPAYAPDGNSSALIMPIPVNTVAAYDSNMNPRYPILPGAAWAFCHKVFALFNDVNRLAHWLDTKTSIDTHTSNAIKAYFSIGDGKHIRSFGSLPILAPTADATTSMSLPIAVLNLHSDRENLLQDNGQTLFVPLLEPFLILLSILLINRQGVKIQSNEIVIPTSNDIETERK